MIPTLPFIVTRFWKPSPTSMEQVQNKSFSTLPAANAYMAEIAKNPQTNRVRLSAILHEQVRSSQ